MGDIKLCDGEERRIICYERKIPELIQTPANVVKSLQFCYAGCERNIVT